MALPMQDARTVGVRWRRGVILTPDHANFTFRAGALASGPFGYLHRVSYRLQHLLPGLAA